MSLRNAVGRLLRESAGSSRWITAETPGQVLSGTGANETLTGGAGHTLVGGAGDDIYGLTGSATVREEADQGIDTLSVWASAELPANVENLTMNGGWGWYGIGNDLDNIIRGTAGAQQIDGRGGDDILFGGEGQDLFVVSRGQGSDLIADFAPGLDRIRLGGFGLSSIDEVRAVARQVGSDTVLTLEGGERLVLSNVVLADLSARDFLLEIDTSRYALTFEDNFNSLSLHSGGGTWQTTYSHNPADTFASRFHNDEAQLYVDSGFAGTAGRPLGLNPFSVQNGILTITAAPVSADVAPYLDGHAYTSGLLTTASSFAQQYGYFEIRAALPAGQGLWPAFWLLPQDGSWPPEIDVFEMLGRDPDTIYFTSHQTAEGSHTTAGGQYRLDTSQFHTYGVDWGADTITFYVDGTAIGQVATPASMHRPFYMLVNLAVGGAWGGQPDASTGVGQMQIDYVRAYALRPEPAVGDSKSDPGPSVEVCRSFEPDLLRADVPAGKDDPGAFSLQDVGIDDFLIDFSQQTVTHGWDDRNDLDAPGFLEPMTQGLAQDRLDFGSVLPGELSLAISHDGDPDAPPWLDPFIVLSSGQMDQVFF